MKRTIGQSVVIASIFALLGPSHSVCMDGVRWAGNMNVARLNILHAPDIQYTPLDPPVTVNRFGPVMRYPSLRGLLGVSASEFARADIIAFEVSPTPGPRMCPRE